MSFQKQIVAGILATKENKMMQNRRIVKMRQWNLAIILCCALGIFTACQQEPQPQENKTSTTPTNTTTPKPKQNNKIESKPKPTQKSTQTSIQNPINEPNTRILSNQKEQDFITPIESLPPQENQPHKKTYTQEMLENITGEEKNEQIEEDGHIYNAHITYKNRTTIKHGREILYYLNGEVAQRAFYVDGKREGLFQIFSQKGVLIYEAYYHNGLLHGPCKLFDVASGKLKSEMNFAYGLQVGQMNIYDIKNGKLWHQLHYKQGKKEGKAVEFDESNKIVREVFYHDDVEIER